MLRPTRNMLFPGFIGSAVLMIAVALLTIVARGPYTHSNLNPGIDPRYTRTQQVVVGAPLPFDAGRLSVPPASGRVELGKQLFVTESCATCHGLDGRGGIVGPSIIGTSAKKLRTVTSLGLKGMPAYAPGVLSDANLTAIEAFLETTTK